jgi:hypothetical protein
MIQGYCGHTDISRTLPSHHMVRLLLLIPTASVSLSCNSAGSSRSDPSKSSRRTQDMRKPPHNGESIEATITKTVEFDIELRDCGGASTKPSQVGDKECGF